MSTEYVFFRMAAPVMNGSITGEGVVPQHKKPNTCHNRWDNHRSKWWWHRRTSLWRLHAPGTAEETADWGASSRVRNPEHSMMTCPGYFAHPTGFWEYSEGISSGASSFPSKLAQSILWRRPGSIWMISFRKTHRSQATIYNSISDLDHRSIFFTLSHFVLDLKRYRSVQINCTRIAMM